MAKYIKNKFSNVKRWILGSIFTLVSFLTNGCLINNETLYVGPMVDYKDYSITGTITDDSLHQPIKGISVILKNTINGNENSTLTDSIGGYNLEFTSEFNPSNFEMKVEDLDNSLNGSFFDKDTTIANIKDTIDISLRRKND